MKTLEDKIQLDMNKKHVIELTTAELLHVIAAYGGSSNASRAVELSDLDVFTQDFQGISAPYTYDKLLEYGYTANIIRGEFLG